jgi:ABC-type glycerol-3-phosphate transport system permease component
VFIDQKVMAEGALRTVFLYPYAMSFVATGLIWQWILNPNWASRKCCTSWDWTNAQFDWIVDQDMAIYTIVIATVWQASGLVMALMLSGLRGVDEEIWKAARIDGIPRWRVYLSIVLPMLGPSVSTAFVLLFVMVVKVFDAVVAMTQGGPGTASEVPAKFIMDYLFGRANIGLASAASIVLLLTVLAIVAPLYFVRSRACCPRRQHERRLETAPHAAAWTPARIGVYGFLIVAALFFLLPLYVMLVTSVKPMEEIRLGTLFALPQHFTLEPWRRPGRRLARAWNATASRAASGTRSPSWCRAPSCRSPSAR